MIEVNYDLIRKREQWFADNAENLYLGALMFCGRPPPKPPTPSANVRKQYESWLSVAWQKMWDMVPDIYKIDHAAYGAGYDRREQAEQLKKGFVDWLEKEGCYVHRNVG